MLTTPTRSVILIRWRRKSISLNRHSLVQVDDADLWLLTMKKCIGKSNESPKKKSYTVNLTLKKPKVV